MAERQLIDRSGRPPAAGFTEAGAQDPPVDVQDVARSFGNRVALRGVSLQVSAGEIHALLGPNGAGKTTLIRILCGVVSPDAGSARVLGLDAREAPQALRRQVGLVPSGDRSFYLRISGLENLLFFGRLHGLHRRNAKARALDLLTAVGLEDEAHLAVGLYSHGMQKRLALARAFIAEPAVLLVDEATHDLDPAGAGRVRDLVRQAADGGTAVLWTTQRIEEIRRFVDRVTILHEGTVRFRGTVRELISLAGTQRYVVRLRNGDMTSEALAEAARRAARGVCDVVPVPASEDDFVLALDEPAVLGDAIAALAAADLQVLSCREEQAELEEAFLTLTRKQ